MSRPFLLTSMYTSLLTFFYTALSGVISGLLYGHLFLNAAAPNPNAIHNKWRKQTMLRTILRCTILAGAFWYLLRLSTTSRILFLIVFLCSFWIFVLVSQRRHYERN